MPLDQGRESGLIVLMQEVLEQVRVRQAAVGEGRQLAESP
jgi:hypothetical protein